MAIKAAKGIHISSWNSHLGLTLIHIMIYEIKISIFSEKAMPVQTNISGAAFATNVTAPVVNIKFIPMTIKVFKGTHIMIYVKQISIF